MRSNYTVFLQDLDSPTLNRSFTFLILMSELCMLKRGKKASHSLGITVYILLFISFITI